MENILSDFLQHPDGIRYDLLIEHFNRAGSNLILATLTEQQKNEIVKAGVDTMGNEDVFFRWLWTTLLGEQAKPIDMIRTGEVARVMELLGRIEHSVYS